MWTTYTTYILRTLLLPAGRRVAGIAAAILILGSCSDDFTDRPPEDNFSIDDFYATEQQVNASTNILYGLPWYQFNNFFMWTVGDISSGNVITWDPKTVAYVTFGVGGDNQVLTDGWISLWSVVAQANGLINNLPDRVGEGIPESAVRNAVGEARFMRALAYFYLVRTWGPVPIIENNTDHVYSPAIPTNRVEDIYTFIKRDLEFAAEHCYKKIRGSSYSENGHVSAGSAKALLAKVHLYEQNYAAARELAGEVIQSGEFKLLGVDIPGSYAELFLTAKNNNEESIMALQWSNTGQYGTGNPLQSYFAHSSTVTGTGDGWGAAGPSIDLQEAYEDGDLRKHPTVMERGAVYPDLNGGFTAPDDLNVHGSRAGIKKYVVGRPEHNGGGASQNAANNTYIMRYAELLLIHAEAILAGGSSTSDAAALSSFNKVRERAGLPAKTVITEDDILHERRIELAIEGDYWYDLGRMDRARSIAIMSNQERGTYSNDDPPVINPRDGFRPPADSDFLFPYPSVDVVKNPKLNEPPVPYDFN